MPLRKRHCKDCGKTDRYLSRASLCLDCSMKRCTAPGVQIRARKGPVFEKWRESMKEYLGIK